MNHLPVPSPPVSIGIPPWEADDPVQALDDFLAIHERRPFHDNQGGMGLPHLFATWYMVRKLNPPVIIESGIWKGFGTWLLEQACPEARIISIDPFLSKRIYISPRVTYHAIDFSEIDWSQIDPGQALVFFDDHQNAYTRLTQCHWFGFRKVIFEDNYPSGKGDFYTLRHAFEESGFGVPMAAEKKAQAYSSFRERLLRFLSGWLNRFGYNKGSVIPQYCRDDVSPNGFDAHFLRKRLQTYAEFPPVYAPAASAPALLGNGEKDRYPAFFEERNRYNHICYVELKF